MMLLRAWLSWGRVFQVRLLRWRADRARDKMTHSIERAEAALHRSTRLNSKADAIRARECAYWGIGVPQNDGSRPPSILGTRP